MLDWKSTLNCPLTDQWLQNKFTHNFGPNLTVLETDSRVHKIFSNLLIIGDRQLTKIDKTLICPITG